MSSKKWRKEWIKIIAWLILGMVILSLIQKHIFYIENVIYRRTLYIAVGMLAVFIYSTIKDKNKN